MNVFLAHSNNITKALTEVWCTCDPEKEPDLIFLPNGKVFKWDGYHAHNLSAKGRISEEEYIKKFLLPFMYYFEFSPN